MPLTIPIAHDFICPWCWIGLFQAQKLQAEFGAQVDWLGYELFPEELEWPDYPPGAPGPANKPPVPSRLDFILQADGLQLPPSTRPHKMRTFNAHEALEYAKTEGVQDKFVEVLYRAYWEDGKEINNPEVLEQLAQGVVNDVPALLNAVATKRFKDNIVGFDDDAHDKGVWNVPTFFIGGERYAEQLYTTLRDAVKNLQPAGVS
jgi:predicted DsbA family dithiol-disulfide isomerase